MQRFSLSSRGRQVGDRSTRGGTTRRFLTLLAVAAVAGGMYAAAAPGRSLHAGPTWKQFTALQKQLTALKKDEGKVKGLATLEAVLLATCIKTAVPIAQYGNPAGTPPEGYEYTQSGSTHLTTGLDVAPGSETGAVWFVGGDATCGQAVNPNGLRHDAAVLGISLPHAGMRTSFAAHRP